MYLPEEPNRVSEHKPLPKTGEDVGAVMFAASTQHEETCMPVLQALWEHVRTGQEQILLSPYLPASCAFLTHVLCCVPFFALDALATVSMRVRSWRISSDSGPTPPVSRWMVCFWSVLLRYLTVVLPVTALLQSLRSAELPSLAPSCWQLSVEVCACFLLFDTLFFIWHFSMHR